MARKGEWAEPQMIKEYYEKNGCGITNPKDELSEGHMDNGFYGHMKIKGLKKIKIK